MRIALIGGTSLVGALLIPQSVESQTNPPRRDINARSVRPGPFKPPAVGTRLIYTQMAYTVTKVDGWRVWFTDHQGRAGFQHGIFIIDEANSELTVPDSAMLRLWPLRLGSSTDVLTARGSQRYIWRFTVSGADTLTLPAGRFAAYRVDGVETELPWIPGPGRVTNVLTWWYAPEVGAPIRMRHLESKGRALNQPAFDLIRIERPKGAARRSPPTK